MKMSSVKWKHFDFTVMHKNIANVNLLENREELHTRVGAMLLNVWFPPPNLYPMFLTSNANLFGSGKILVIIMMNLPQLNLGVRYWSRNLIDPRDSEGMIIWTWISSFPTQKDTGNLHIPLHVYLSIQFHGSPVIYG